MTKRPTGRGPARAAAREPAQTVFRAFVRTLEKVAAKPAGASSRAKPKAPKGEAGR